MRALSWKAKVSNADISLTSVAVVITGSAPNIPAVARQGIGPARMTGKQANDMLTTFINDDHRRIAELVVH